MPRTEISRRSRVGALTAWPGLSPVRRPAFAGAREPVRYLSVAVYSSLFAERGLPGRSARRYVHSRLWVLHRPHLHIPLDLRPLRSYRSPGSYKQAEKQQFLHDFTSLLLSSTSDSTSLTASPTAARTGSLSSINMSS